MKMASEVYEKIIKEEMEYAFDENDTTSEGKCDAREIVIFKKEYEPEYIKSEEINMVLLNLKTEEPLEVVKERSYCEVCGGDLLSPSDFFSPDSLKSSCNCQCQHESNAMQDPGIFRFETKEETVVGKENEFINENMPSMSSDKEMAIESVHFVEHEILHKTEEMKEIFSSEYHLNSIRDSRVHEGNEICSKNMKERTDVESVENQHMEKPPLHHKISTNGNSDLKSHEKNQVDSRPFQCKICSKSFTRCYLLKRHEQIHTGEKPFQCKICPKSFIRCYDLQNHEKIHTGEKQFQCKTCSKSFIVRSNLKNHEKLHTDEKPFQCKICPKSFIQKSFLKWHEKVHTGENPFQCKICSKSFTRSYILKRHEQIHTGEKPFQCKICHKSFIHCYTLTRHEKIHTG